MNPNYAQLENDSSRGAGFGVNQMYPSNRLSNSYRNKGNQNNFNSNQNYDPSQQNSNNPQSLRNGTNRMQQPSYNGGLASQFQPNNNGVYPSNNNQPKNGFNNNLINNNNNGSIAVNAGPTNPYANINNYNNNNNNNNIPRNNQVFSNMNQNIDNNNIQMKNNQKAAPGYNVTPQGTPPLPSQINGYTNKYKNRIQIMCIITHITLIILFFSQMIQTGVFIGSYNDIVDSNYSVSD